VVTASIAAATTNGSMNSPSGVTIRSPDGCTDAKSAGIATWSARAIPVKPAASASRAISAACRVSEYITGNQCSSAAAIPGRYERRRPTGESGVTERRVSARMSRPTVAGGTQR
jgi:hypothetical protein